ncbi:Terpene synthase [Quillaja saponaria]|uniref:Terpene synthase n=1 Tax=Quillaja saponaria TaxID=32244 RepID=A0AAD7VN08_QUISA|nr:Terpene synthase [Quillaja saponaria]
MVAKQVVMLTLVDDTYDAFGTIEELKLLTEAVQRWDTSSIDILPECMKLVYRDAILKWFSEYESLTARDGQSQFLHYAIDAFKRIVGAYFKEAEWCNKGYVPTYEEYMKVAGITGSNEVFLGLSFIGMGNIANKEIFDWLLSHPKSVRASNIIGRLMDDVGSYKFERNRKHVASAVECYMKQYGVSEKEAVKVLEEEVKNAWKDINEDFLRPTAIPAPMIESFLGLTRTMNFLYEGQTDKFTDAKLMKDYVASVFVDPFPVEDK